MTGRHLSSEPEIDAVLDKTRTVVVVGLSPHPTRPSHRVAKALQDGGVRILPVNPCGGVILGETVFPALKDLPDPQAVDVIDVFRRPEALPKLVEEILAVYPRSAPSPVLWFQFGVTHSDAEFQAREAGMDLVVDRCLLIEHLRWQSAGGRGGDLL